MKTLAVAVAPLGFSSLFTDGVSTGLSDKELLDRFTASRDSAGELAFATLVARHGPMVLSVCRRMLRDPHETEDAFQATFLVLVRKRSGIRVGKSLGPWLYGVSVRVARQAQTTPHENAGSASTMRSPGLHLRKHPLPTPSFAMRSRIFWPSCLRIIGLRSCCATGKGLRTKRPPADCNVRSALFAAVLPAAGRF